MEREIKRRPASFKDMPFPVAPNDFITLQENGDITIGMIIPPRYSEDYLYAISPAHHPNAWALLLPLAEFEYDD